MSVFHRSISFLRLAVMACAVLAGQLHAASVTAVGIPQVIGNSYDAIGIAWREAAVTKTNDLDGDNIFGSLGYWLAKTNTSPNESSGGFDTTQMTFSAPAWLSVAPASAAVNKSVNYGYRSFQNPVNPAGRISVGYMGRYYSGTLTPGTTYSLYDFTIGSGAPAEFSITIATHSEMVAPTALQLAQTGGGGNGSVLVSSLPANGFYDAVFTTYKITGAQAGDVFQLGGQTTSTSRLMINAILIDGAPPASSAPVITGEPASLTVTAGNPASFTVLATGTPAPSYQWRKNGDDVPLATASTYTINTTTAGDAGNYTCFVSNSAGSVLSAAATLTVNPAPPPISGSSQWKNLDLRGMGFVTGILTHPASGEIYTRTDVAGIFRWDAASSRWVALLDDFGNQIPDARNVESLALDPNNPNRLFAAYGTYVEESSGTHGILRSDDKGLTWTPTNLSSAVRMGGNSEWRHAGERLAVDPANSDVVYFGSRQNGLWRSTDGGMNWSQIPGVPVGGNNGATRNGLPVNGGITFVTIDSAATTATNGPTRSSIIYLGIMDVGVYQSTDGGDTFSLLGTQPEAASSPIQGKLATDGTLYVTLTSGVWRWRSSAWTVITPPVSGFTYSNRMWAAVAVDPANPDRIAINDTGNTPRDLFISSDAGATWIIHTTDPANAFPAGRHKAVTFTLPPWIAESDQKFSWSGAITFAPGNSNQIWLTTGYGVYVYQNLTAAPVVANSNDFMVGLEELVGTRVAPLPGGGVLAGVMDKSGFVIRDPALMPAAHIGSAAIANSTGIGISAQTNTIVASLASGGYAEGEVIASDDGGQTWRALAKPFAANPSSGYGMTLGGDIAVSATHPNNFVWIPLNPSWYPNTHVPIFSANGGASWTPTTGLPTFFNGLSDTYNGRSNVLASDTVNGLVFYAYYEDLSISKGSIYRSTDGGATWSLRNDGGLPGYWKSILTARPGTEGELWYSDVTTKLLRSTDGGATFANIAGWTAVKAFGFGAPLPGESQNTLYVLGTRGGVFGVYYSVDDGASWVLPTGLGAAPLDMGSSISGDLFRPGRIYLASGGRGLFYVDLFGGAVGTAPTFIAAASSASDPVVTASTSLSALASDEETAASSLVYAWSAPVIPIGGGVTFSESGTNAAQNTTAHFSAVGSYTLRCTVTDSDLRTATSDVIVTVEGSLASLIVNPAITTVPLSGTQSYAAQGYTAHGLLIPSPPAVTWSVNDGGSIAADGTFVAGPIIGGPFTVAASSGAIIGTASVSVNASSTAITAVHWLGNYGAVNKNFRSTSTQKNLTLDNVGTNNDSRRYLAWSETIPYITPDASYSGTSDTFYGGFQYCRFGSNTAPNASSNLPVFGMIDGASNDVSTNDGIGLNTTGRTGAAHAHFVWLKPGFLGTAATTPLGFDASSRLTLSVGDTGGTDSTLRWANIPDARWFVREGSQWFVSQTVLPAGTADKILTFANDHSDGNWAPVNPAANLNLDLAVAVYSEQNFSNLSGFGYYLENDAMASTAGLYAVVDEFKVEAAPVLPAYAAWQNAYWPGVNSSAIVGPTADPDGDGIPNLLEYGLGTSPSAVSTTPVADIVSFSGQEHLQLQWTRPTGRSDITTLGEVSPDLSPGSWTSAPAEVSVSVNPAGPGEETVTVQDLSPMSGHDRHFLRVRIALVP